ncbi:MAG: AAA family ATPase, partial [Deltaproteobacteria bacterium]|nr:AAA family ATPase [Deltaproteobacteria bacterium]
ADPGALSIVMSAAQAFDYVGMPEGRFHLSEACLYLATAPKSNSGFAFFDALQSVQKEDEGEMPNHLRDANRDKEGFGHGQGYLYPHAYHDHWVPQQYLPMGLQGRVFYQPTEQGYEAGIGDQVARRREAQLAAMLEFSASEGQTQEEQWQGRTLGNTGEILGSIRDYLFASLSLDRQGLILILLDGSGLLLGEALRLVPEGTVYALVDNADEEKSLNKRFLDRDPLLRPVILKVPEQDGVLDLSDLAEKGIRFDAVIGRAVLSRCADKRSVLEQISGLLSPNGVLALAENVPVAGQRLSEYMTDQRLDADLRKRQLEAEEKIYLDGKNSRTNWRSETMLELVRSAGFRLDTHTQTRFLNEVLISSRKIDEWFTLNDGDRASYADQLRTELTLPEIEQIKGVLLNELAGKVVQWKTTWLFFKAVWKKAG